MTLTVPKFYNGLVQIIFHVLHPCVCTSHWIPSWCFWIAESFELKRTLESLYSSVLFKAGWGLGVSQKDAKAQQCWGTALVGAAFRKLLSSCLNCQCEKVFQNRPGCLKTGVKDLGFFRALCLFLDLGLGVYQPCFDQNEITLPSKFGSCPGQQLREIGCKGSSCSSSTIFSVDVDGALWGCCENIRALSCGEHKHPHMVFVPYFTPAHPLPLFFSPEQHCKAESHT